MILNIEELHAGLTIEAYLKQLHFSRHQISRLKFRRNGILVNGKQARVNRILCEGDELELNLNDDKAGMICDGKAGLLSAGINHISSDYEMENGNKSVGDIEIENGNKSVRDIETGNGSNSGRDIDETVNESNLLRSHPCIDQRENENNYESNLRREDTNVHMPGKELEENTKEMPVILYEDACILIVNKPGGIVCHPAHGHFGDTMMDIVDKYLSDKEMSACGTDIYRDSFEEAGRHDSFHENLQTKPYLIGRLDKDTSGALLFAKNQETAALLAKQRERGLLQKTYLALCQGIFAEKEGMINEPIAKVPGELNRMMISPDGKAAETYYHVSEMQFLEKCKANVVLKEDAIRKTMMNKAAQITNVPFAENNTQKNNGREEKNDAEEKNGSEKNNFVEEKSILEKDIPEKMNTLVEVRIRHGRTHQIRLHMSSIGHPLVGDPVYGGYQAEELEFLAAQGQAFAHLHAWKLELQQPFTGAKIQVEAPISF